MLLRIRSIPFSRCLGVVFGVLSVLTIACSGSSSARPAVPEPEATLPPTSTPAPAPPIVRISTSDWEQIVLPLVAEGGRFASYDDGGPSGPMTKNSAAAFSMDRRVSPADIEQWGWLGGYEINFDTRPSATRPYRINSTVQQWSSETAAQNALNRVLDELQRFQDPKTSDGLIGAATIPLNGIGDQAVQIQATYADPRSGRYYQGKVVVRVGSVVGSVTLLFKSDVDSTAELRELVVGLASRIRAALDGRLVASPITRPTAPSPPTPQPGVPDLSRGALLLSDVNRVFVRTEDSYLRDGSTVVFERLFRKTGDQSILRDTIWRELVEQIAWMNSGSEALDVVDRAAGTLMESTFRVQLERALDRKLGPLTLTKQVIAVGDRSVATTATVESGGIPTTYTIVYVATGRAVIAVSAGTDGAGFRFDDVAAVARTAVDRVKAARLP